MEAQKYEEEYEDVIKTAREILDVDEKNQRSKKNIIFSYIELGDFHNAEEYMEKYTGHIPELSLKKAQKSLLEKKGEEVPESLIEEIERLEEKTEIILENKNRRHKVAVTGEGRKILILLWEHKGKKVYGVKASKFLAEYTDAPQSYIREIEARTSNSPWWSIGQSLDKQIPELWITGAGKGKDGKFIIHPPEEKNTDK